MGSQSMSMWECRKVHAWLFCRHGCAETNVQGHVVQLEHVGISGSPECECARGPIPTLVHKGQHVLDVGKG